MLQCPRCGHTTKTKGNMQRHLQRKTLCHPLLRDIRLEDIYEMNKEWSCQVKEKPYVCGECQATFTTSQARSRHVHHFCKGGMDSHSKEERDKMERMEHQIQTLTDRLSSMEQNSKASQIIQTNCGNVQVNMVNAFGKEDVCHLTTHFLDRCVKKTNVGLIELLDKLHFGTQNGCNANVRIMNRKLPLAEVNDGQQWKIEKKDKVLNRMVDKGHDMLQGHLEEHQERIKEQLSESMWEHIQEYFERMEVRDEATIREVLDDVYIMLLNKSRALTRLGSSC